MSLITTHYNDSGHLEQNENKYIYTLATLGTVLINIVRLNFKCLFWNKVS